MKEAADLEMASVEEIHDPNDRIYATNFKDVLIWKNAFLLILQF
jgi:hypothetical protein